MCRATILCCCFGISNILQHNSFSVVFFFSFWIRLWKHKGILLGCVVNRVKRFFVLKSVLNLTAAAAASSEQLFKQLWSSNLQQVWGQMVSVPKLLCCTMLYLWMFEMEGKRKQRVCVWERVIGRKDVVVKKILYAAREDQEYFSTQPRICSSTEAYGSYGDNTQQWASTQQHTVAGGRWAAAGYERKQRMKFCALLMLTFLQQFWWENLSNAGRT